MSKETHPFPPIYDEKSSILILGTFPSVKSRENEFYYGHPQNRFWKVLAAVFSDTLPKTTREKKTFLLKHKVALWDVIQSCDIIGSADNSIKKAIPNNIPKLLQETQIRKVFLNGQKAYHLYLQHFKSIPIPIEVLPSTSPANAAWSMERLIKTWSNIKK